MIRLGLVASLALLLSACGATLISNLLLPPGTTGDAFKACLVRENFVTSTDEVTLTTVQARLATGIVALRDGRTLEDRFRDKGFVNKYLDCYIAPVDQSDVEGRLLRGHIVLSLLSQYGAASLVAKERVAKADDAIAMQGHIRRAQFQLLSASPSGLRKVYGLDEKDSDNQPFIGPPATIATATRDMAILSVANQPNFHSARRVAAVFDVGLDIMRVDGRYVASLAGSVFDIVSGAVSSGGLNPGTFSKLKELMGGVAQGLQLAALNQWYGPPLIFDAELAMIPAASPPVVVPTPMPGVSLSYREIGTPWMAWQRRLNAACDGLGLMAGGKKTTCLPTAEEMADFIEEEYGAKHPFVAPLRNKAKDDAVRKAKAAKQ